ncbi:unnamed protein product [Anisakis simplex]|uniref:CRAL-TRIO domain-containing protein n=1 Tax=Anisakis simplex TaxID=6269 RepID=A0A0M3J0M5_ANISI|nr:unnamed protein product [Anisakis simplex]
MKFAKIDWFQWGRLDFYGMLQTYSIVEILRSRIYDLEDMQYQVMELEKETGKQAAIINVLDMTNLKYNKQLLQMVYGPLRNLADFVAMHYVELFKYFVVVNVPSFVYALWTAIRPLLPERTRDKVTHLLASYQSLVVLCLENGETSLNVHLSSVRILSSSNWRSEILEYASVDVLPAFWNLPGDDQFKAVVELPRPFDENDYCSKNFKVPKGAMKLRVPAGELQFITMQLDVGQKLSWWIMADRDFGFGVFYTEDLSETDPTKQVFATVLISFKRMKVSKLLNSFRMQTIYPMLGWLPGPLNVPLQDSITAQRNGHYKVLFTNSRAWWHTLNATYVIEIE